MTTTYDAGRYLAEIIEQGFGESSKGTPFFFLQFRVLHRHGASGDLVECPQYERTYRQYLGDDKGVGFRMLQADLRAIGIDLDVLTRLDPADPNPIMLIGRQITVDCRIEPYNGKDVEHWGIAKERKKLTPDAVRELAARFANLSKPATETPSTTPTPNDPNGSSPL